MMKMDVYIDATKKPDKGLPFLARHEGYKDQVFLVTGEGNPSSEKATGHKVWSGVLLPTGKYYTNLFKHMTTRLPNGSSITLVNE